MCVSVRFVNVVVAVIYERGSVKILCSLLFVKGAGYYNVLASMVRRVINRMSHVTGRYRTGAWV